MMDGVIGIGWSLAAPPLPHHVSTGEMGYTRSGTWAAHPVVSLLSWTHPRLPGLHSHGRRESPGSARSGDDAERSGDARDRQRRPGDVGLTSAVSAGSSRVTQAAAESVSHPLTCRTAPCGHVASVGSSRHRRRSAISTFCSRLAVLDVPIVLLAAREAMANSP